MRKDSHFWDLVSCLLVSFKDKLYKVLKERWLESNFWLISFVINKFDLKKGRHTIVHCTVALASFLSILAFCYSCVAAMVFVDIIIIYYFQHYRQPTNRCTANFVKWIIQKVWLSFSRKLLQPSSTQVCFISSRCIVLIFDRAVPSKLPSSFKIFFKSEVLA